MTNRNDYGPNVLLWLALSLALWIILGISIGVGIDYYSCS